MTRTTLIGARELAGRIADPDWIVVDCRHDLSDPGRGRADYALGHIPGAHFLHLDQDLAALPAGGQAAKAGRHPLPDPEAFATTMDRIGLTAGKQLVAYDAQGGIFAARLWWMLRHWAGHDAAAVLDGGWDAWIALALAISSAAAPSPPAGARFRFRARKHTVDAGFVLDRLGGNGMTIIDARAPDRFRGENETLDPVGGRIPGARNRYFRDNLDASGSFKPAPRLREEFASILGQAAPDETVHQCGSGVSACHNILAMELAGYAGMRLYPGSWSEWCADPARPVATGEPGHGA